MRREYFGRIVVHIVWFAMFCYVNFTCDLLPINWVGQLFSTLFLVLCCIVEFKSAHLPGKERKVWSENAILIFINYLPLLDALLDQARLP